MARPLSFDKDRYILRNEAPPGIDPHLKLTLDEFLLFDKSITVDKCLSRETRATTISIKEACSSIRKKHQGKTAARLYLHISAHDDLDGLIRLPKMIEEKSLFELCWPSKRQSNYFKYRNKIFYFFHQGHETPPIVAYGGATEWLYLYSGCLDVELSPPTDLNLCLYAEAINDEESESTPPFEKTVKLQMTSSHFLVIPAGWISVKKASKSTCAIGGEILHADNLSCQMESFERDVIRSMAVETNDVGCKYAHERDSEIRYLYWFYASYLWTMGLAPSMRDSKSLPCLLKNLTDWRNRLKKIDNGKDYYVQQTLFAPQGLELDSILRSIRRYYVPQHKTKLLTK